jgi:signal transduction histidine kinase
MLGRHQNSKRSRSVRAYVVRLVIAVALPLLVFGAFLLIRSASNEQQAIATTVHERAQGAAADLDRELRNLQDLVSLLASSNYLFVADLDRPPLSAVPPLRDRALGLVVRDLSGKMLLNTCTTDGRPFPVGSPFNDVQYARNPAQPYISNLVAEPITGEPLLTIDLPIWHGDGSNSILSLCALPRILRILIEQHLPKGWAAAVFDGQGHTITSIQGSAGGGSFTTAGEGPMSMLGSDGYPVIDEGGDPRPGFKASSPVSLAGWTVAVSVPSYIFYDPMRRALLILIVAGGGTLAVAIVLAVIIGRRIAGSLTRLTSIAKSLGSGGQPALSNTGIDEADLIADVLCSTGKDLHQRTAELTQSVEALRHGEIQLRKLSEELRRALVERGELLNRVVSAQEGERQRIARELHDHLGQYFAAMLLGLNAAGKASIWHWRSEGHRRIADLKNMTSAMSREVHRLSWELRPTALDDLGLEAAIANYLEKWSGRFNLNVDFAGNIQGRRLSPPVEITLYRVLQEAMTNIAKHAYAERISVVLEAETGGINLIVEDDGIGFSEAAASGPVTATSGFGLLGIRERLALVGGSLIIEPASDHGTALFCRIPA